MCNKTIMARENWNMGIYFPEGHEIFPKKQHEGISCMTCVGVISDHVAVVQNDQIPIRPSAASGFAANESESRPFATSTPAVFPFIANSSLPPRRNIWQQTSKWSSKRALRRRKKWHRSGFQSEMEKPCLEMSFGEPQWDSGVRELFYCHCLINYLAFNHTTLHQSASSW